MQAHRSCGVRGHRVCRRCDGTTDRRAVNAQEPGIRNRTQRARRIRSGSHQQFETIRGRAGWPDSGHPERRRAAPRTFSNLSGVISCGGERGLLGMAIAPELRDERPVLCQLYRPCREHRHRALPAFGRSGGRRPRVAVRSAVAVRASSTSSSLTPITMAATSPSARTAISTSRSATAGPATIPRTARRIPRSCSARCCASTSTCRSATPRVCRSVDESVRQRRPGWRAEGNLELRPPQSLALLVRHAVTRRDRGADHRRRRTGRVGRDRLRAGRDAAAATTAGEFERARTPTSRSPPPVYLPADRPDRIRSGSTATRSDSRSPAASSIAAARCLRFAAVISSPTTCRGACGRWLSTINPTTGEATASDSGRSHRRPRRQPSARQHQLVRHRRGRRAVRRESHWRHASFRSPRGNLQSARRIFGSSGDPVQYLKLKRKTESISPLRYPDSIRPDGIPGAIPRVILRIVDPQHVIDVDERRPAEAAQGGLAFELLNELRLFSRFDQEIRPIAVLADEGERLVERTRWERSPEQGGPARIEANAAALLGRDDQRVLRKLRGDVLSRQTKTPLEFP